MLVSNAGAPVRSDLPLHFDPEHRCLHPAACAASQKGSWYCWLTCMVNRLRVEGNDSIFEHFKDTLQDVLLNKEVPTRTAGVNAYRELLKVKSTHALRAAPLSLGKLQLAGWLCPQARRDSKIMSSLQDRGGYSHGPGP